MGPVLAQREESMKRKAKAENGSTRIRRLAEAAL
jgi:hypothetical protein